MLTVWVDHWQVQCCGEPFRVGSGVTWRLAPAPAGPALSGVLGERLAATVTHTEDHHEVLPGGETVAGTVRSIRAVRCRFADDPASATRTRRPVAGSAAVREVDVADGGEPADGEHRFVGYLVALDPA